MAKTTKNKTNKNVVNEVEIVMDAKVEFVPLSLDELKEIITIKNTIGVIAKQTMVHTIYNSCVRMDADNGIYYIDYIMQSVAYYFAMLEQYTNFYDVVENAQEYSYEYLKDIGMFDYVSITVSSDLSEVDEMVNEFVTRVADLNSMGSFIYRIIGEGIKNMPKLDVAKILKDIPNVINGIDKDIIKTVVGELKGGNGGKIINMANAKKK